MLICREHITPQFHFFNPRNASSSATSPKAPLLFGNPSGQSLLVGLKHLPWRWYDPYEACREAVSWLPCMRKRPSLKSIHWFTPVEHNRMLQSFPIFTAIYPSTFAVTHLSWTFSWQEAFLTIPGPSILGSYILLFMQQIYTEHMYEPGAVLGAGATKNSKGPRNSVTEWDS